MWRRRCVTQSVRICIFPRLHGVPLQSKTSNRRMYNPPAQPPSCIFNGNATHRNPFSRTPLPSILLALFGSTTWLLIKNAIEKANYTTLNKIISYPKIKNKVTVQPDERTRHAPCCMPGASSLQHTLIEPDQSAFAQRFCGVKR